MAKFKLEIDTGSDSDFEGYFTKWVGYVLNWHPPKQDQEMDLVVDAWYGSLRATARDILMWGLDDEETA